MGKMSDMCKLIGTSLFILNDLTPHEFISPLQFGLFMFTLSNLMALLLSCNMISPAVVFFGTYASLKLIIRRNDRKMSMLNFAQDADPYHLTNVAALDRINLLVHVFKFMAIPIQVF